MSNPFYYASHTPIQLGVQVRPWGFVQQASQAIADIRKLLLSDSPQLGVLDPTGLKPLNAVVAIEVVFEDVRVSEFPQRPSRWTSTHLCASEADVVEFALKYQPIRNYIYEVAVDPSVEGFKADQILLNAGLSDSGDPVTEISQMKERARRYWSGELTRNPFVEVIVPGNGASTIRLLRILDRRLAIPQGQTLRK